MQYATTALTTIATVDKAGHIVRRTVEVSAEILNEVIIDLSLSAIESGIIVRRWFDNGGRDRLVQAGWNIARGIALFIMLVACLVCVAWFATCAVWAWINKATDDGLGLYGPSPMLQEWFGSREQISLPCGTVATAAEVPVDAEWAFARFGRYEGEVPEGGELVEWANSL